jgi:hypothetical protein
MSEHLPIVDLHIQSRIFTIRGLQVMLDRDLAELYQVETRALKQAVRRNSNRFPDDFMFALSEAEVELLVSQSVIPSKKQLGGAKPFVFTEQGVATLSSVLTSNRAIEINIHIMRAFVQMRKFIANNAVIFQRLDSIEDRQQITETRLDKVFEAIEAREIKPKQGIFFDGQVFDAYAFVSDLIKSADKSIVLIDNYVDENTLILLAKRKVGCSATIYTHTFSKSLQLDLQKHNAQYPSIEIKTFKQSHDRFLILDDHTIYHFGASLKDLGKKMFAFSRFDKGALEVLGRLG